MLALLLKNGWPLCWQLQQAVDEWPARMKQMRHVLPSQAKACLTQSWRQCSQLQGAAVLLDAQLLCQCCSPVNGPAGQASLCSFKTDSCGVLLGQ